LGRVTNFGWCGCGGLESIVDPLGRVTTWMRDLQGRVTSKIYPDSTQVSYGYESRSGRLRAVTDAKNQTTLYDYFGDNNLKQLTYSNAVVATPGVSFTYDTNFTRVATMIDGIGTNTYSYYPFTNGLGAGRLLSIDGPLSNDTISYEYDELDRVTSRAIDGVAQAVTYDALGRVTIVTNALGSFTNNYVNATYRLSSVLYPNGQSTVFNYLNNTNDQRLEEIKHLVGTNVLSKFNYTYDADGQIQTWTQQADNGTPKTWVMNYDPVDQLLGATVRS
jgi:YD repeat-containing protein